MKVKDLMSTSIVCARPQTSIRHLAALMKQEDVGSIPICNDKNEVLGIVTDRDIVLRYNASTVNKEASTAEQIMSKNIIYVTPNMNTHDAALLFSKHQVRRLPVISNGKLAGIFTLADVAKKTFYIDEAGDALSAISKANSFS